MQAFFARAVRRTFRSMGYDVVRAVSPATPIQQKVYPTDFSSEQIAICEMVKPFTMTSPERIFALCEAVRYVQEREIAGSFVECGTWRGGSMIAAAQTLMNLGEQNREFYLFDTFEGMSAPTAEDKRYDGCDAQILLNESDKAQADSLWCAASLDEVKKNLQSTNYDAAKMHFIKGKVEDTIPQHAPETIALLRLDTDWYESTKHEMEHLFPRLSPGGILILDDYGFWQGAREAVDEYLQKHKVHLLLNRIDETGRITIKL